MNLLAFAIAAPVLFNVSENIKLSLKLKHLEDPDSVPFSVRHEVVTALPETLCGREISIRVRGRQLQIDTHGNGSFSKRIKRSRPEIFILGKGKERRSLLIYSESGRWFAAPADLLRGSRKDISFEFLDANLDGDFAGKEDYVRQGDAAFCPIDERGLYAWKARIKSA